ncbi:hypothetical protein ACQEVS_10180 [Streptomyces sp. CA-181903]|uniref:hypothetical protein n=1 Tax=Streptomyces sp. CA-181903 TaxID=3240055 RepID=UPI003D8C3CD1
MPENALSDETLPLLISAYAEAYGRVVRRQTCTELAEMLRNDGQLLAANLVEDDREFRELSPSSTAGRERARGLRRLLDSLSLTMLSELRETAAASEEAALRRAVARRIRALVPGDGRQYVTAVLAARDSKLCMGHSDFSDRDVELYAAGQDDPNEIVDLDDAPLSGALGTLAELLRPDDGAQLVVDLVSGEDDG